jgi:hypothetical protein
MAELAPNLLRAIPKKVVKNRTVAQALHNRSWVRDIRGALSVQVWWNIFKFGTLLMEWYCSRTYLTSAVGS